MYLFAFRSRTQSMKFYDILRIQSLACELINTPREVSASCGLSVTVAAADLERAYGLYRYYAFDTAIGIFYREGDKRSSWSRYV